MSIASKTHPFWRRPGKPVESGIRRVAVIGAGPIGVSTAKFLVGEDKFDTVDVYEQQSSFGGAWIWSQPDSHDRPEIPQADPFGLLDEVRFDKESEIKPPVILTPMYDALETNIPHILMNFSEKAFPSDAPLFPHRTTVLKYIEDYSQEIKNLVRFGHQVTSLKLTQGPAGQDLWILAHKDVRTGQVKEEQYDAVALANGHFAHMNIPDACGIREWDAAYPGSIKHSKFYRRPEDYADKKVVVVGNASSGIDIGSQIAGHCRKPLILSARSEPLFKMPAYAEHISVPGVAEFVSPKLGKRAIKFADGSIEEDIDIVLFCTGYYYSFPFLEPVVRDQLINTGTMVHNTYQHLFWVQHPTLAFLGLPNKILPMPLGEAQAVVLARVWSGRLSLPSKPKMQIWVHQRWRNVADMLKMRGKPTEAVNIEKAFLSMGPGQDMAYHNEMIQWASEAVPGPGRALPHQWGDREIWIRSQMAPMKKAYAELSADKKKDVRRIEELGIDYEKFKAEQEELRVGETTGKTNGIEVK